MQWKGKSDKGGDVELGYEFVGLNDVVRESDSWADTYTGGESWSSVGSSGKPSQIEGISWNTLRHVQGIAGRPGDESGMSEVEVRNGG